MSSEQTDKDVLDDALDKITRVSGRTENLKRAFSSLSVENRLRITKELNECGDNVGKLTRVVENLGQRYGPIATSGLRSGTERSLVRGEQRILIAGEPLPFDIIASEPPRIGGTCTVLKVKMGNELYAMKRLNANISLEAFRREEGLLKDIKNPHITQVFGSIIDTANRLNIILTPWCSISLETYIRDSSSLDLGSLSKDKFLYNAMACIMEGMVYLHQKRLKHCDLKLSNLLFQNSETGYVPIISDFGISKRVSTISQTKGQGFTPDFASPQQLRLHEYGRKTDVFSLALIYIHMIFKAAGKKSVHRHLRKEKYLGPCPGLLSQGTMDDVLDSLLQLLKDDIALPESEILLKDMLKISESERISMRDARRRLRTVLQAEGISEGHCTLEHDDENEEEGEDSNDDKVQEPESDSEGHWSSSDSE